MAVSMQLGGHERLIEFNDLRNRAVAELPNSENGDPNSDSLLERIKYTYRSFAGRGRLLDVTSVGKQGWFAGK